MSIFIQAAKKSWGRLRARIEAAIHENVDFDLFNNRIELLYEGWGEEREGKNGGNFRRTSISGKIYFATQNPEGTSSQAKAVKAGDKKANEVIWMYTKEMKYLARFERAGANLWSMFVLPEEKSMKVEQLSLL